MAPTDAVTAARHTLRRLAQRIQALTTEERQLQQQITTVLKTHAPQLLQRHGIGPDSVAALLITAGDNPDRLHSEAFFAARYGVNPILAQNPTPPTQPAAATAAPMPPSTASSWQRRPVVGRGLAKYSDLIPRTPLQA